MNTPAILVMCLAMLAFPAPASADDFHLVFQIETADLEASDVAALVAQSAEAVRVRLERHGMDAAEVTLESGGRLAVRWSGTLLDERKDWRDRIVNELSRTSGGLEFFIVADRLSDPIDVDTERKRLEAVLEKPAEARVQIADEVAVLAALRVEDSAGTRYRWAPQAEKIVQQDRWGDDPYVLLRIEENDERRFTGGDLKEAKPAPIDGGWGISIEFRDERAELFGDFTEENKGRLLAFVVGGRVVTQVLLMDRVENYALIRGGGLQGFTIEEVTELLQAIRRNTLPANLVLVQD